jgi:phospholipid N-methyltransferase
MLWWLKKLAKNPAVIGSVAPSGPSLAGLMTHDLRSGMRVLELGPGSGAITEHILKKLKNPADLTLVEYDQELAAVCGKKFPGVSVHCGDAETLLARDAAYYDAIISGIPFAAMDKAKRQRVFNHVRDRLNNGGTFIMFQYSVTTLNELKAIFREVKTGFTPLNIPPAFVFFCKK